MYTDKRAQPSFNNKQENEILKLVYERTTNMNNFVDTDTIKYNSLTFKQIY